MLPPLISQGRINKAAMQNQTCAKSKNTKSRSASKCRHHQLVMHKQSGSILVQFALLAFIIFCILGTVQIGHMYYAKRDLQRTADIAAIEAVNALTYGVPDTCKAAKEAGELSAKNQLRVGLKNKKESFLCGHWDPSKSDEQRFDTTYGDLKKNALNAVQVTVGGETLQLVPFFSGNLEVSAMAIGSKKGQSVAAFSVGSQLLRFNEKAALGSILNLAGLNVNDLRLLDSDGLASANITPSGLLKLLGADVGVNDLGLLTPNGIANISNITLLNIIDASISTITDSTLAAQLSVLRSNLLKSGIGHVKIPLGTSSNSGGLFAFIATGRNDPLENAMNVDLSVGELLKTAIAIGTGRHAVEVPQLNILGLIKGKVTIVEPPTIAVGPIGTTGYSAQIRILLDIDTRNLLGGLLNGVIEGLLGTRVHLPLAVDVVAAQAELKKIQCQRMPATIDLAIDSRILNACVGNVPSASAMSERHGCEVGLGQEQLITLLHVPILSGKLHIPGLRYEDATSGLAMEVGETRSSKPNQLLLGTTVDNLVTGLLNLLSGLFQNPQPALGEHWTGDPYSNPNMTARLVESYLDASKNTSGFYNVDKVSNLVLNGGKAPNSDETMPPLLLNDFEFDRAIPKNCVISSCSSINWSRGKFSAAFKAYTSDSGGLLGTLGISTFDNGYRNCAGLLSALLSWNSCVKHNLTKLLTEHSNELSSMSPNSQFIKDLTNPSKESASCNGVLCVLLKPVLNLLKPILNGVGQLVSSTLEKVLGIELGRSDVQAIGIQCESAEIAY